MRKPEDVPAKERPSIGRPKAASVRDHWISFRVTVEEHFLLLDKAQRSGLAPGEYARSRAMRGIVRAKKVPAVVPVPKKEEPKKDEPMPEEPKKVEPKKDEPKKADL